MLMRPTNLKHKHCYKEVKAYVRDRLRADKFTITNHKIIRFCWKYDNDNDKVKQALKEYADAMKQYNLREIQALPKEKANYRNLTFQLLSDLTIWEKLKKPKMF